MRLKCIVSCLLLLSILPVHAKQITVNEVESIQSATLSGAFGARAEWNALTYYFQGIIEGAAGYQEGLGRAGKSLLFCPPAGKGYSIEELMKILSQSSRADRKRPASLVVLEAYARKYPCKG